jgi:hypothetical protein
MGALSVAVLSFLTAATLSFAPFPERTR